ncbi:MAG: beta-L-arabinofuranosidase domain-containing protein [bacterium]
MKHIGRRDFVVSAVLLGVAAPLLSRLRADESVERTTDARWLGLPFERGAHAFALKDIRLGNGTQRDALLMNRTFMMGLDPDRILHTFRVNAGLPSRAEPLGGWEAPVNELRGHFAGHYLSACALYAAATGDDAVKQRGTHMVTELSKCQQALGGGYLSAFPTELFDRLRANKRVWAPFYTYHKILAGLLDSYTLSGNAQALAMAKGMAAWTKQWTDSLDDAQMAKVLEKEFGGMSASLYDLSEITGDSAYATLAHRFDQEKVLGPLAESRDELKGVHGNTTIPKIIGAARRYELTGDTRSRDAARYFWTEVTSKRCFATGGTTNDEGWDSDPGVLSKSLGRLTQESCVSYNMLKLTRQLFEWEPQAAYGDYYERVYYNGILPTQHPADGEKAYYTPLAPGYWKLFGAPNQAFWCCHGTGVESFSKLGDSVYFHDDDGVYVNLFVASQVAWKDKGVSITQNTSFPAADTTSLTVKVTKPTRMALRVRMPYWATKGGRATINGKSAPALPAPSNWYVVDRVWSDGDRLDLTLPMSLHVHAMPDDPSMQAIMYGPLVLVGKLGTNGISAENRRAIPTPPREVPDYTNEPAIRLASIPSFVASSTDVSAWINPVGGKALEFRTTGQATDVTFVPLHTLFDERYAVYWVVRPA